MTRHLYIHPKTVVVSGQINESFDEEYPVAELPIMGVTGDMGDVKEGMTVLFGSAPGLDDLGRQRVRGNHNTSDEILMVGYSSRGVFDGQINVAPEDYFTVLYERRPWSKAERLFTQETAPFVTVLKDYDRTFESSGAGLRWYPKANAGPARAGNINAGTGLLTVDLPGPLGMASYTIPGGIDLTDWLWDVGAGTITVGSATDPEITATFPPGLHYPSLTVTDENGMQHTMYTAVFARDPANDTCIPVWEIQSWSSDNLGSRIAVRIDSDIPRAEYPDGTVVMMFDDTDPDHHTEFYGWHHSSAVSLAFGKTGAPDVTVYECLGILGKADLLRGEAQIVAQQETVYTFTVADDAILGAVLLTTSPLPMALQDDDIIIGPADLEIIVNGDVPVGSTAFAVEPLGAALTEEDVLTFTQYPRNWGEMRDPSLYKWLDYLVRWGSNIWDLTDMIWPEFDASYAFVEREVGENSLYRQINEQARALIPEHLICCNAVGQVLMRPDAQLVAPFNRTDTVQASLVGHISAIRVVHQRPPRVGQIRGAGVVASNTPEATVIEVEYTIRPSAEAEIGATVIPVYELPVTIPDNTTLLLRGLEGQLLPWVTTDGEATAGATSINVDPLTEQVDVWTELVYVAEEAGPGKIVTVFCLAPGRVRGQGEQIVTLNNKLVQNQAGLNVGIGLLYARLNAEYGLIDVDLVDDGDLGLDPAVEGWVTLGPFATRFVPARDLPLFTESARYGLLEVNRGLRSSKTGKIMQTTLRLERETSGPAAITVSGEEVA